MTNYQLITSGFQTLRDSMSSFIARELIRAHGNDDWWRVGIWNRLYDYQRRNIPEEGDYEKLVDSLDIANCLLVIDINWRDVFRDVLPQECRSLIFELKGARNKWAHFGGEQPTQRDTWRTLDTMSRLCAEIDSEGAAEIEELIGTIVNDELSAPAKLVDTPIEHKQDETAAPLVPKTHPLQNSTWRFMPKAKWTKATLNEAIEKWCTENQRTLINGFNDLDFTDAAEAALTMPLMDDNGTNSFCSAADNIIFLINDAKMMALTVPAVNKESLAETNDRTVVTPNEIKSSLPETNEKQTDSVGKERLNTYEQFVHIPKKKASWTRGDILKVVDNWSKEHSRNLPVQVWQWRLDTLADMVLSRFPEQSDLALSFNDSLSETLFAPSTRKLLIMTYL